MIKKNILNVFDCGATNARVIVIDGKGKIISSGLLSNRTKPYSFNPAWRIWDAHDKCHKMYLLSGKIISETDKGRFAGATVTRFGVDGTIYDQSGTMLYPVISVPCKRTSRIMGSIGKYIPLKDLYRER